MFYSSAGCIVYLLTLAFYPTMGISHQQHSTSMPDFGLSGMFQNSGLFLACGHSIGLFSSAYAFCCAFIYFDFPVRIWFCDVKTMGWSLIFSRLKSLFYGVHKVLSDFHLGRKVILRLEDACLCALHPCFCHTLAWNITRLKGCSQILIFSGSWCAHEIFTLSESGQILFAGLGEKVYVNCLHTRLRLKKKNKCI